MIPGSAPLQVEAARAALAELRRRAAAAGVSGDDAVERAWVHARLSPMSLVDACRQVGDSL